MQETFLKMNDKPKRFVCLDTETTGLRVFLGARIIEIGMVEMFDSEVTGREFQSYLKANEKLSDIVKKISNISDEMLEGKPDFSEIAPKIMEFLEKNVKGEEDRAILVIHNAKFDLSFLNFQLQEAMGIDLKDFQVIDTIDLIRNHTPGARLSLDSVAEKYSVDLSERQSGHGALIDSKILAKVFNALRHDGANIYEILDEKKQELTIKKREAVLMQRDFKVLPDEILKHEEVLKSIKSEAW